MTADQMTAVEGALAAVRRGQALLARADMARDAASAARDRLRAVQALEMADGALRRCGAQTT